MKREALLRELRKIARERGLALTVIADRGKGGHIRVNLGERMSTIQSGELTPLHVRTILRQLGVD
ncbi:hypothetical protein NPA31_003475 [Aurantimonas sp. MSK8Z-1]|uniref:hypothetical protein n=1 Tax=Mangrovibrevibacter kandeliae TaxID=2968473 RepID=UPI002119A902|nr:hypothetical protein [Aurantimonas sp. MSK8Z-1]MCW4114025.1 hypothetical protein [Aurantimonas sp. MSK8Z-1]